MLKDKNKGYVSSTIQFDKNLYKQMKVQTALLGITLKEFVNEAIVEKLLNKKDDESHDISDFNEETIRAIESVEKNCKKLSTYKNSKELFEHLGI